jgi:hypothetical protein
VHPSVVDLRPCKQIVMKRLPPGHAVREAILAEPDELPWPEASVKLQTYGVMLVRQAVSP